ncbi:hypothetical protein B296_00012120 [Ensete ventricosum]|uniref:Uncharacterized protein n=1 Tax=Ensete ventricosum TaxID=4639 RepID=A0A427B7Z8_ENSVE|nr:hypothetical protein B296_00012120 [Ensete ventricosum]
MVALRSNVDPTRCWPEFAAMAAEIALNEEQRIAPLRRVLPYYRGPEESISRRRARAGASLGVTPETRVRSTADATCSLTTPRLTWTNLRTQAGPSHADSLTTTPTPTIFLVVRGPNVARTSVEYLEPRASRRTDTHSPAHPTNRRTELLAPGEGNERIDANVEQLLELVQRPGFSPSMMNPGQAVLTTEAFLDLTHLVQPLVGMMQTVVLYIPQLMQSLIYQQLIPQQARPLLSPAQENQPPMDLPPVPEVTSGNPGAIVRSKSHSRDTTCTTPELDTLSSNSTDTMRK